MSTETTTPASTAADSALRPLPARMVLLVPCYNEGLNLPTLIPSLYQGTRDLCGELSMLIVDDGSKDDTVAQALKLSQQYPVEILQLSRNFGKENAITAGLDYADGDVVVILDGDGQHPGDTIAEFVQRWREGYDMAYGVRIDREEQPAWRAATSKLFYWLLSGDRQGEIVANAGDFRLLDRSVIEALRMLPENNRFMKGLYAWVGFNSVAVPFEVIERQEGVSSFNFRRLFGLALTGITAFSTTPLRVWSGLGAMISLGAIIYGLVIMADTMIYGNAVPGWTTLSVGMMFLGGIQLFSIGVLGEYIGRIFSEVKKRPTYIVSHHYRKNT